MEDVRRTGVYLLVGPDPDDPSHQLVYVGESDIEENIILCPRWAAAIMPPCGSDGRLELRHQRNALRKAASDRHGRWA